MYDHEINYSTIILCKKIWIKINNELNNKEIQLAHYASMIWIFRCLQVK